MEEKLSIYMIINCNTNEKYLTNTNTKKHKKKTTIPALTQTQIQKRNLAYTTDITNIQIK